MRKLIWTYGIAAGLIVSINLFSIIPVEGETLSFEGGELRGFLSMALAFALIFIAVKVISSRFFNGQISFGKSFVTGLYITLIASVMYVISWEFIRANYIPNFADQYLQYRQSTLLASGADAQAVEKVLDFEKTNMEMYDSSTFYRMSITFSEIFPIGFLFSLLAGLLFGVILKKRNS